MEAELKDLCQQANALNLNLVILKTSKDNVISLDSTLSSLQVKIAAIRAKLEEEEKLLQSGLLVANEILQKVKGKPLASAMKTNRTLPFTPNHLTPSRKAVSFDIKTSSPLSVCHSLMSTLSQPNATASPVTSISLQIVGLSSDEFEQIPKYMKGRLTLDKINATITLLNQLYTDKYAIMAQNPNKLPHEFRQRYWDWKELECDEVMGRRFITEADIKAAMQNATAKGAPAVFKLDPLGRSVLAILRHYGRIREVRTPGVVRFVIL